MHRAALTRAAPLRPPAQQVQQILSMNEKDIVTSWSKANVSAGRNPAERDYRLSYILWRVWFLRRKREQVELEEAQRSTAATDLDVAELGSASELESMAEGDEDAMSPRGEGTTTTSPPASPRAPSSPSAFSARSPSRASLLMDTRLPPLLEGMVLPRAWRRSCRSCALKTAQRI